MDEHETRLLPGVTSRSFEERRRHMDASETAVLGAPEKRTRLTDADLELYAYQVSDAGLPSGWSYDERTNSFLLGEPADYWSFEDGFLVRHHLLGRTSSFHATESEFPIPVTSLQSSTGLTLMKNSRTIAVNGSHPTAYPHVWVGKTLYPLTKEAAEERGVHYAGDMSKKFSGGGHFRCRGQVWNAQGVPRKKVKESSADLREGKMTLEEREAFVEGKKAELASIFENGVWEVEADPHKKWTMVGS